MMKGVTLMDVELKILYGPLWYSYMYYLKGTGMTVAGLKGAGLKILEGPFRYSYIFTSLNVQG